MLLLNISESKPLEEMFCVIQFDHSFGQERHIKIAKLKQSISLSVKLEIIFSEHTLQMVC